MGIGPIESCLSSRCVLQLARLAWCAHVELNHDILCIRQAPRPLDHARVVGRPRIELSRRVYRTQQVYQTVTAGGHEWSRTTTERDLRPLPLPVGLRVRSTGPGDRTLQLLLVGQTASLAALVPHSRSERNRTSLILVPNQVPRPLGYTPMVPGARVERTLTASKAAILASWKNRDRWCQQSESN